MSEIISVEKNRFSISNLSWKSYSLLPCADYKYQIIWSPILRKCFPLERKKWLKNPWCCLWFWQIACHNIVQICDLNQSNEFFFIYFRYKFDRYYWPCALAPSSICQVLLSIVRKLFYLESHLNPSKIYQKTLFFLFKTFLIDFIARFQRFEEPKIDFNWKFDI